MFKKALAVVGLCGAMALCADDVEEKQGYLSRLSGNASIVYENERISCGSFCGWHILSPKAKLSYHFDDDTSIYAGALIRSSLKHGNGNCAQVDPFVGIERKLSDKLVLDAGYKHYFYTGLSARANGIKRDVSEIYGSLTYDNIDLWGQKFTPSIFASYNFDTEEVNIEGAMAYHIDLSERLTNGLGVDLGAKLGYDRMGKPGGHKFNKAKNGSKDYVYLGVGTNLVYNFNESVHAKIGVAVEGNAGGKHSWMNHSRNGKRSFVWFPVEFGCEF